MFKFFLPQRIFAHVRIFWLKWIQKKFHVLQWHSKNLSFCSFSHKHTTDPRNKFPSLDDSKVFDFDNFQEWVRDQDINYLYGIHFSLLNFLFVRTKFWWLISIAVTLTMRPAVRIRVCIEKFQVKKNESKF